MGNVPREAPSPDFDPSRFIIAGAVCLTVSAITLSARMYVRLFMIRAFGVDDLLLLLAFVSEPIFEA
jgi:hypothetical protein